ncbi:MAG: ATP-binding protein [Kiritimatiellia bacterium]|jgi:DNA polymerase III delta prime subunit
MKPSEAFEIVKQSHRSGRMPHAYIVCGSPRGNGLELAESICAFLLCTADAAERPCRTCDACLNALAHKHVDALWVEPEKKSRIISVDVMREQIVRWEEMGSYVGGWKIAVLLFADRLNESSANAFLKTLEEPGEQTLFLLVTDRPEALLPTIVSRCQRLDLNEGRVPPAEPWRSRVGDIMAQHASTSALRIFATAGKLVDLFAEIKGEAEKLGKQEQRESEFEEDKETVDAWVGARSKEMRQSVFESIRDWYRDLLVLCACEGKPAGVPLFFEEHRERLVEKAAGLQTRHAMLYMDFVDELERHIEVRNIRETIAFPYWFTWLK